MGSIDAILVSSTSSPQQSNVFRTHCSTEVCIGKNTYTVGDYFLAESVAEPFG